MSKTMMGRCLVTAFISLLVGLSLSTTPVSSASFSWSYKADYINSLDVEGEYIAASTSGSIYIFDTRGKLLYKKNVNNINSVAIAPTTEYFLVGARDGFYEYDKNGELLLKGVLSYSSLASSDGKYAVGKDLIAPRVYYFDNTGTEICKYETDAVKGISISGDGENFIVGTRKGANFLASDCSVLWKYAATEETTTVSLSKDGNFVAVGSLNSVHVLDRSGNTIWKYETDNSVGDLSISAKGNYVAAILKTGQSMGDIGYGKIVLFDKDGKIIWSYDRPYMTAISMSPDGRYIAIGTDYGIDVFENTAAIEFTSPPQTPQITTQPPPSTTLSPTTTPPPSATPSPPVLSTESTPSQIATIADLESKAKDQVSSAEKQANDLTELLIVGKRIGADVSIAEQKISNAILLLKEANSSYVLAEEKYKGGDVVLALNYGNNAYLKGSSGMSMLDEVKAPLYAAIKQRLTDIQLSTESAVAIGRIFRIEKSSEEKLNLAKDEIKKVDEAFWSNKLKEAKVHILNANSLLDDAKDRIYYISIGLILFIGLFAASLVMLKKRITLSHKRKAEESIIATKTSEQSRSERLVDSQGVLSISSLSKRYKNTTILKNINLQIKQGVLCAVIGPSGSGKSTLVEIIAGRVSPTRGSVNIFGKDQNLHRADINRLVGFVPQHPELSLEQTAWGNMMNSAIKWQVEKGEEKSERILKQLGIYDRKDVQVKSLSGGQLKRLSLAMELIREPPVLILDEPTTGLDPSSRDEVITSLSKLVSNDKKTVIFSTHYMDEADHADEVVLLGNMQILAQGPPNELVRRMPGAGKIVDIVLDEISEDLASKISGISGVRKIIRKGRNLKIVMDESDTVDISQKLKQLGGKVARAEITNAGMNEVFVYYTGAYPEEQR